MLILSFLLATSAATTLDLALLTPPVPAQAAPMPPPPTLRVRGHNGWAAWTATNTESVSILAPDLTPVLSELPSTGRLHIPAGTYLFVAYGYNERSASLWVTVK